ncbi:MAG: pyruvate ferredoxin oxidoreductase, partial [Deltaproteobacteria bacterium]|nr:pyruvate ferredoxin oxidoreductase [Deltaproteobacteria bacterium]
GFEPSETLRAIRRCNAKSVVVTNLTPLPPFTVTIGSGVYPDLDELQMLIRNKTKKLIALDAVKLAKEAGSVLSVNMVLLGSLIQTDVLPITAENVKTAIETKTKKAFVGTNIKAFDLGYSAAELSI